MPKIDNHRIGRLASVAGLGLSLAFGVAPVTALATPSGAAVSMAGEESVVTIADSDSLKRAIESQADGQTWLLTAGTKYEVENFEITADNITIKLVDDSSGYPATISRASASYGDTQNSKGFVTVSGNNVTISGVSLQNGSAGASIYLDFADEDKSASLKDVRLSSSIDNGTFAQGDVLNLSNVTIDYTPTSASPSRLPVLDRGTVSVGSGVLSVYVKSSVANFEELVANLPDHSEIHIDAKVAVSNTLTIKNKSDLTIFGGNSDAPITASSSFVAEDGCTDLVRLEGCSDIVFREVRIVGTASTADALHISNCDDIVFAGLSIDHSASPSGVPLGIDGSDVVVSTNWGASIVTGPGSEHAIYVTKSDDAGRTPSFVVSEEGGAYLKITGEGGRSDIVDASGDKNTVIKPGDYSYVIEGAGEGAVEHAVNIAPMEGGTLSPDRKTAKEGDFVRLYIVPDKGMHFVIGTISVVDAGGNPVETGADVNGYFYFIMPDSAVTAKVDFAPYDQPEEPGDPDEPENPDEPEQPTLNFPDVQEGAWYYGGVQWAVETGLMAGNADGTFAPTASLSRAQLAVLLWNFAGNPEPSDSQAASGFTDTDPNGFYSGALAWCVENGYLMGLDAERFAPSDAITREQLAVVFWRAAGSPESDRDLSKYPDAGTVSEFAGTAMRWAVEKGILSGQGDGTLDPQGKVDRAQAAVIFQRIAG